jgi:ribosomal protein S27E
MEWLRTKCADCLKEEILPLIEAVGVASRKSNHKKFMECACNDCFTKETPAKIEEHVSTFWKAYCLSYYY